VFGSTKLVPKCPGPKYVAPEVFVILGCLGDKPWTFGRYHFGEGF